MALSVGGGGGKAFFWQLPLPGIIWGWPLGGVVSDPKGGPQGWGRNNGARHAHRDRSPTLFS